MALKFTPSEFLVFQRPLIHTNKETLVLKNCNAEAVIFKIKTTAPKRYCVRPNAGRIDGFGQIEVEVMLQPFKAEPPVYFQCKDKFLIQSAAIQRHYENVPATEIWHSIETQNPGAIHQQRIRCDFGVKEVNPTAITSNLSMLHDKLDSEKMNEAMSLQYSAYPSKFQPPVPSITTLSNVNATDDVNKTSIISLYSSTTGSEEENGNSQTIRDDELLRQNKHSLSDICLPPPSTNNGHGKSSTDVQLSRNTFYQILTRWLPPTIIKTTYSQSVLVLCVSAFLVSYLFL